MRIRNKLTVIRHTNQYMHQVAILLTLKENTKIS